MKNSEIFFIIKEIEALNVNNSGLALINKEQRQRIERLESLQSQKKSENQELLAKTSQLQEGIIELESKLKTLDNEYKQLLKNQNEVTTTQQEEALKKRTNLVQEQINNIENSVLGHYETIETLETDIKDNLEFIQGSQKSIEEILEEVNEKQKTNNDKSESNTERIHSLLEQLPLTIQDKCKNHFKKSFAKTSLTFSQNKSCIHCGLKLSVVDEIAIEEHLEFKTCSGCKRIFIPNYL